MSNKLTSQLFKLVKSLNKAEKRHFKIYAKRNFSKKTLKFVQLFDIIDKMEEYNEQPITQKIPGLSSSVFSNLKAHLYEQLLISLRLLNHTNSHIRTAELISFAYVLLQKGLYMQSLTQLARAKKIAEQNQQDMLLLEIVEFEKRIESRRITRSYKQRADNLTSSSKELRESLHGDSEWSDFALMLYDFYLKAGHIKNEKEYEKVKAFFYAKKPKERLRLSFYGSISRQKSYVWYYYITQEFAMCYKHALKWINKFEEAPHFKQFDPELYMKGLHNALSVLYYSNSLKRFRKLYNTLSLFIEQNKDNFSIDVSTQALIIQETAHLNLFFLEGRFTAGAKEAKLIEERFNSLQGNVDKHRTMVFRYKIACLMFGSGNYEESISYINKIINEPITSSLREDVQGFARILNLLVHFELGNDELLISQIRSTYRFLLKLEDLQKVQKEVLWFLKRLTNTDRSNLKPHFIKLKKRLELIAKDKYELRPFLYLDLISWLESKIENERLEDIIRRKNVGII